MKKPPTIGHRIWWFGLRRGWSYWIWDHLTRDGRDYWRNA